MQHPKNYKNYLFIGDLIDELGGFSSVAKICNIRAPSVYGWLKNGIPNSRLMYLQLAYPKLLVWEKYDFNRK